MASQFDLKNARLYIEDGYSNVGAVNLMAGYTTGLTTMAVDGITGIIPTGTTFTLGADVTIYTVTAHTETSSNTTSITFTPGLIVAATDDEVITFLPHQVEVRIGEGNFTWEEKVNRQYMLNYGLIDNVRNGDEAPTDVTFDFVWDYITSQSGDPPTLEECLKGIGGASNWISSDPDGCQPYSVDLVLVFTPLCVTEDLENIKLAKFRYESLSHNAKDGTIAVKGSANVTGATSTRTARAA